MTCIIQRQLTHLIHTSYFSQRKDGQRWSAALLISFTSQ